MCVLIVDDHAAVRRSLAQALQGRSGIEVVAEAPDGDSAVRLAKRLRPDVVLMDVVMPGLDGIEATRQIVQNHPQVRIIGLSVHDSPVYVARMLEAGASAYLLKDCDLETLIRVMQCPGRGRTDPEDEAVDPGPARSGTWAAACRLR
jgi:two-component system response regulator DegU